MSKTILEAAMQDAKLLKNAAMKNAQNLLLEAFQPKIREFVESQLGEAPAVGSGMMGGMAEESPMYEKHDDEKDDLELMKQLGVLNVDANVPLMHNQMKQDGDPSQFHDRQDAQQGGHQSDSQEDDLEEVGVYGEEYMQEAQGAAQDEKELDYLKKNGGGKKEKEVGHKTKSEEDDEVKESAVVEITNEDLKEALSEVLGSLNIKTEATVTKGFGDYQTPDEGGLARHHPEKNGQWSEEFPPDAEDFTVKEAKRQISVLKQANAKLKTESASLMKACTFMKNKIQEVNLFNSKLLYTQKLLNSAGLNNKQRVGVIEAFDRAQSMREVELVYKSLSESFKIAGVLLGEGSKKTIPAKSGRFTTPSSTLLREAVSREEKEGEQTPPEFDRMALLAGLKEIE